MKKVAGVFLICSLLAMAGTAGAQYVEHVSATLFSDTFRSLHVVGDLAYSTGSNVLQIISIADTANPVNIGGYSLPYISTTRDVFVSGNYAYLTYFGDIPFSCGVLTLDVTDPFNVTEIGRYEFPDTADAIDIIAYDNYAYMAVFGHGLYILDISDPSNPGYVGGCNTSIYKIFVSGDYVYAAGDQFEFDLKIIDVSDPSNPVLIGSYGTPGYVYSMFISGNYGFVCWYYEQVIGSEIIDISDPANPVTITSIPDICGDVIIRGDNAYVARGGLHVIDVSDPANPQVIGIYDSEERINVISISGDYAYLMWPPWQDYLERFDPGGFEIINIVNPQAPSFAGKFRSHSFVSGVFVDSIYSYVADGLGLQIIDISLPSVPSYTSSYETPDNATDVFFSGSYAYATWGYCRVLWGWEYCDGGLRIIDISDPAVPILVGSLDLDGKPTDIIISGNLAYILQLTGFEEPELVMIDVSDPSNPLSAGSYDDTISDIFVSDTLAYLACDSYGLLILDVSDPSQPSIVGTYDRPNVDFEGVFVSDDHGYFAVGDTGLYILDISNPANPTFLGSLDTPHDAKSVFVSNDYAYMAAESDNWEFTGLLVIDVSEPSDPIFAGSHEVPGIANDVFIENYYIYVADGSSLRILRFDPQTGIIEDINAPGRFSLSQNYPNPFNASTIIKYDLPEACDVTIEIYDILGRKIQTRSQGKQRVGHHTVVWNADGFSSGMYFYRIQAGEFKETKKMLLLK